MKRDSVFDSLKGIAILGIVLVHSYGENLPYLAGCIKAMGATGTTLFLMISAYFSFLSYEKNVIVAQETHWKWLLEKLFRIIPLYYFFLFLRLLLGTTFFPYSGVTNVSFGNAISHLLFINSFFPEYANSLIGVEWFVGIVVFYYFVTPLVYKVFNNVVKAFAGFVATSLLALLVNHFCVIYLFNGISSDRRYVFDSWIGGWFPLAQLEVLFAGLIVFQLIKYNDIVMKNDRFLRIILSTTMLCVFIVLFSARTVGEFRIFGVSNATICVFIYFVLIMALEVFPIRLIVNPIFAFIGKYTYGIFLCHTVMIGIINSVMPSMNDNFMLEWLTKYAIAVLTSLGVSVLLAKGIEEPLLNKMKRERR